MVGTHVSLHLGYKIQNRKFNMSRKHVYIFLHTLGIENIINKAQQQPLTESLEVGTHELSMWHHD